MLHHQSDIQSYISTVNTWEKGQLWIGKGSYEAGSTANWFHGAHYIGLPCRDPLRTGPDAASRTYWKSPAP